MEIKQIDFANARDTKRFFEFPFRLYRNTSQWVPPMATDRKSLFGGHPFFEHSVADYYLVEQNGEVLGRIAAMHNRNHNSYRKCKTAFFGFFECVDDAEVSRRLFSTACEWARTRGLEEIIGPRGLMGSDGGGILVDGFDHRAALNENYGMPYYDNFVREAGFVKDRDHLSGCLPGNYVLPERFFRIAERVKQKGGFSIQSFRSADEVRAWVPKVLAVHGKAFTNNHEYFPPSAAEVKSLVDSILMVADPRLLKLVLREGEVIGFIISYHDIAPALQKSQGKIWPTGWWQIVQERKRAEWVNVNGIGLLPEYRGLGANTLLYTELQKTVHAFGFKHIEVIQVDEFNFKSKSDMEAIGVLWYKRHRSYRCKLS
jgi:GNAT superfamily N-acetyltransferase